MLKRLLYLLCSTFIGINQACASGDISDAVIPEKHEVVKQEVEKRPYYNDRKHGWYWYEKEPEPQPEHEKEQKTTPEIEKYTYEQLWNMYPDQFQQLLKTAMKKAIQYPTEDNVLRYLTYQDIARRKSTAFASVMQYVGQKHPELSNADVYPITTPGRVALADMKSSEIDRKIREVSDRFALIVFSQPGCKFCEAQSSILKYFTRNYNWTVRTVNINERPELSAKFGIEQTPTIILIKKHSKDFLPVATGVISLSELKTRVYRSIRIMLNETRPEQWFMYDFEKNKGSDPLKYVTQNRGISYEIKN